MISVSFKNLQLACTFITRVNNEPFDKSTMASWTLIPHYQASDGLANGFTIEPMTP
jgi:hypothetical protein